MGRVRKSLLRRKRSVRLIGTEYVDEGHRVRGRRHVVGLQRCDALGVAQYLAELSDEEVLLFVTQREPAEPSDVVDVLTCYRHGNEGYPVNETPRLTKELIEVGGLEELFGLFVVDRGLGHLDEGAVGTLRPEEGLLPAR